MRVFLAAALLLASTVSYAQFNGCGFGLCPGSFANGFNRGGGTVVNGDCANPTNGQIDLSVCSNAIYVALVI